MKNTREKISSAPQQRIYLLNAFVQPKIYDQGTFANFCKKDLRKMDMLIRCIVKQWTRLPKDLATAIIHANVRDGGSDVMSNLTMIQRLRKKRKDQCGTQAVQNIEIVAKRVRRILEI